MSHAQVEVSPHRHPHPAAASEEDYIPEFKLYASGYSGSPYGVEWMKFDRTARCRAGQRSPHVAFVVDDLQAAIAGKDILIAPDSPSEGVTVAFIVDNGAPSNSCNSTVRRTKSGRTGRNSSRAPFQNHHRLRRPDRHEAARS